MNTVHVPVMGFTQTIAHPTGLEMVWRGLRGLSSPTCWVMNPLPWDTDADAVAGLIHRNAAPDAEINVYAYSWGCGNLFLKLAAALAKFGRGIGHAVLCDPVYRARFIVLDWLALTDAPNIVIPANVASVSWFRQFQNRPRGHDLVAADPARTRIEDPVVLSRVHQDMDDAPEFARKCFEVAGAVDA